MITRLFDFLPAVLLAVLCFGFGFLVGAGQGIDLMRRDAVAEGYGVRERDETGEEVFRWRTSEELERKPARRAKAKEE